MPLGKAMYSVLTQFIQGSFFGVNSWWHILTFSNGTCVKLPYRFHHGCTVLLKGSNHKRTRYKFPVKKDIRKISLTLMFLLWPFVDT